MYINKKNSALIVAIVFAFTTILPVSIGANVVNAVDPATLTLQNGQNGYNGSIDISNLKEYPSTHGSSWMGYFSDGKSGSMRIQDDGGFGNNGLINFDLSQIPATSTIISAQLKLYQYWGSQSNGSIDLFRITDTDNKGMWVEGQLQSPTAYNSSGAAYLKRDGGFDREADAIGWTNVDGSSVMDSVESNGGTPVASASIELTNANKGVGWVSSSDVKDDIQSWVNGTAVNQGWYIRARKGTGANSIFASNQVETNANAGNNIAYRPMLVITYIPGIATPTPIVTPTPTPTPTPPPPELPRVYLDTTYKLPTSGQVIKVTDGGDLQAAIDQASCGDIIELQAGSTFIGHFNLPNKSNDIPMMSPISADTWIYITSSAYSNLPVPGNRVSPSDAVNMPKIITDDSMAAINVSKQANHYRFVGIEIATTYNSLDSMNYNVIDLSIQSGLTQVSELANNITFDRCYIHGTPTGNVKRGISGNCASLAVIDSYMSEFHTVGFDNQAIGVFNGPGPFKIVNNYLSAACENVMFGGADAIDETFQPQDIEIRGNYFYKPMSWRIGDPSYAGIPWSVKNLFELKNAKRVLFDGNILENHWVHAQAGPSILITPRNQDGTNPWAGVENVTITNNILRHVSAGFNISGSDDNHPSKMTNNVLISNNVFESIVGAELGGGTGNAFQMGGAMDLVTIDHNTIASSTGGILSLEAPKESITNFKFTNNIIPHNASGVYGTARGMGNSSINYFFFKPVFTMNVMAGGSDVKYPAGNFFPLTMNDVGFVNYNNGVGGDYHLGISSVYKNAGTDGKDLGADIGAVEYATSGVLSGISPIVPTTPEPSGAPTQTPTATPEPTPTPTVTVTPTPTPLLGDVSGDGIIQSSDALKILQSITGKIVLTDSQKVAADVTKNGLVQSSDALKILHYVSGKITSF